MSIIDDFKDKVHGGQRMAQISKSISTHKKFELGSLTHASTQKSHLFTSSSSQKLKNLLGGHSDSSKNVKFSSVGLGHNTQMNNHLARFGVSNPNSHPRFAKGTTNHSFDNKMSLLLGTNHKNKTSFLTSYTNNNKINSQLAKFGVGTGSSNNGFNYNMYKLRTLTQGNNSNWTQNKLRHLVSDRFSRNADNAQVTEVVYDAQGQQQTPDGLISHDEPTSGADYQYTYGYNTKEEQPQKASNKGNDFDEWSKKKQYETDLSLKEKEALWKLDKERKTLEHQYRIEEIDKQSKTKTGDDFGAWSKKKQYETDLSLKEKEALWKLDKERKILEHQHKIDELDKQSVNKGQATIGNVNTPTGDNLSKKDIARIQTQYMSLVTKAKTPEEKAQLTSIYKSILMGKTGSFYEEKNPFVRTVGTISRGLGAAASGFARTSDIEKRLTPRSYTEGISSLTYKPSGTGVRDILTPMQPGLQGQDKLRFLLGNNNMGLGRNFDETYAIKQYSQQFQQTTPTSMQPTLSIPPEQASSYTPQSSKPVQAGYIMSPYTPRPVRYSRGPYRKSIPAAYQTQQ